MLVARFVASSRDSRRIPRRILSADPRKAKWKAGEEKGKLKRENYHPEISRPHEGTRHARVSIVSPIKAVSTDLTLHLIILSSNIAR